MHATAPGHALLEQTFIQHGQVSILFAPVSASVLVNRKEKLGEVLFSLLLFRLAFH
jgi:hypothetical protein